MISYVKVTYVRRLQATLNCHTPFGKGYGGRPNTFFRASLINESQGTFYFSLIRFNISTATPLIQTLQSNKNAQQTYFVLSAL